MNFLEDLACLKPTLKSSLVEAPCVIIHQVSGFLGVGGQHSNPNVVDTERKWRNCLRSGILAQTQEK